jgi:hypothetical protein
MGVFYYLKVYYIEYQFFDLQKNIIFYIFKQKSTPVPINFHTFQVQKIWIYENGAIM